MSFLGFVSAYLLGGVTFLPLALFAFVYFQPKKTPKSVEEPLRAGEIEEYAQTGLDCFKQGWIFVTHEDVESQDEISSKTESVAESQDVKLAYSLLYKLVTNNSKVSAAGNGPEENLNAANSDISAVTAGPSPVPPGGMVLPQPKPNSATKKHRYYGLLKHGNLFLYKNEKLQDVKHVIVLSNHIVSLWPRALSEASLFTKYSLIAILKNDWSRPRRLSDNLTGDNMRPDKISIHDVLRKDSGLSAPPGTIFVHTDLNIDKEDWYFALIRATKSDNPGSAGLNPAIYAKTLHLETQSMISLIQNLYGSEGQLQLKWFNAIIGRLFLSLQKTDFMRDYLTMKIERKLNKIKTPGFLDKFQITGVDAGRAAPTITFPVLKEINPEGDLLVSFNVHYAGEMSMQLATKVNINLGLRFKTREVDVLLSITLEKISGPMLVRIKAPPSSRIWYTYEREPDMSIKIEPVVSLRQMSYSIITNTIEKKFKDAIRDSLVLPHWDDVVFCHTPEELYRGGIWEKDVRAGESDVKPRSKEIHDSASDTLSVDTALEITADSEELGGLTESTPAKSSKAKVSKTISDISRRLRKPKSTHTLEVDETNCLSDGSVIEPAKRLSPSVVSEGVTALIKSEQSQNVSTLRKLGEWYSKADKLAHSKSTSTHSADSSAAYHPPDMISNRRSRKQSSSTLDSDVETATHNSLYDFGQELNKSLRIPRTIDVAAPTNAKPTPPKLPPRNLKAPAVNQATLGSSSDFEADPSDTVTNVFSTETHADEDSIVTEKIGGESVSTNHEDLSLREPPTSDARVNDSEEPLPEQRDDDLPPYISTAPR